MALNFSCNTAFPPERPPVCDVVAVAPALYVCTALESHSGKITELGAADGCCGAAGTGASVDIAGVLLLSSLQSPDRNKSCHKQETRVGTRGYLCDY